MIYVVQTFSSKEIETINEIKDIIDESVYTDIYSPSKIVLKKFRGEYKRVNTILFPGYIFIEASDPLLLYNELKRTTKFTKLLGRDSVDKTFFQALSADEVAFIYELMGKENKDHILGLSNVTFSVGNEVVIVDGPLLGLSGFITKINLHKRLATVSIELMGRTVDTELGINIIDKKDI